MRKSEDRSPPYAHGMSGFFSFEQLKDSLILLRLPFSLLLLPVYLFALTQASEIRWPQALAIFVILHLLFYPASNGYNCLIDRDTEAIGGLEKPPPPPALLGPLTLAMDLTGLAWAWWVGAAFALSIGSAVLASRAYSAPWPRLKRYPILSFLTIFVFQGAVTFMAVLLGVMPPERYPELGHLPYPLLALSAACLVGAAYPLSQIYQHESDAKRGDLTLSRLLGLRGTLLFSGGLFALGTVLLGCFLPPHSLLLLLLCTSPAPLYFLYWSRQVWRDPRAANFQHTMRMNGISALSLSLAFALILILRSH